MAIDHPAAREELAHFSQALSVIAQEQEGAQERLDDARAALDAARRFDPDNLPVREMQFSLAEQGVRELRLAGEKPYFTRVDFHEEGGSAQQYYIGKNGVTRFRTLEPYIVDWRAPVANLYYSGQVGPMEYESPDGLVRGEMTLKRQFGVEKGQLKTIFDSGIAAQDEFLQSVLGAVTGERLTEIVTTIQAEQNAIIRHPLNRSLIVQGVAGSGKTSIALHRIAFLLYTYQDRLRAESTLILAPNPLFLQYIAPVLPDLGVERVRQTTFSALLQAWLGTGLPPIGAAGSPASVRVKGLLSTAQRLDAWLDAYEERILPEEGLSFGPVTLFSGEALRQFILVDEKPFPLERRFKELKKQLSGRVKHAVAQIQQWYKKEAQRRAVRMQDDPQRRERLFAQLDERMQAAEDKSKEYIKETMRAFGDFAPAKLYRQFWEDMRAGEDPELRAAAEETLARKGRAIAAEDAALIALIAQRVSELKRQEFRHIVVDEAQDMSQAEFLVLRRMNPGATFTIVGDMMQGVNAARGLSSWDALAPVLDGPYDLRELITSYRSTVEIILLARRVWENCPSPVSTRIEPVLRHGDAPLVERVGDVAARVLQQLERWKHLPSVAVIAKTEADADALCRRLPGVRRLDVGESEYHTGVLVASAAAVKGLEFDGVIVADASAAQYAARVEDAKLLYVALTRALHHLCVFYADVCTPLLDGATLGETA